MDEAQAREPRTGAASLAVGRLGRRLRRGQSLAADWLCLKIFPPRISVNKLSDTPYQ